MIIQKLAMTIRCTCGHLWLTARKLRLKEKGADSESRTQNTAGKISETDDDENIQGQVSKPSVICSGCGHDHKVVIIPLKDGSRRIISTPFPDTETKLARLGLRAESRNGRKPGGYNKS